MDDRFEWLEDWRAPGICRLAQSRVVYRGPDAPEINPFMSFCGIWMLVHENEAMLLEAPFAPEDAGPILESVRDWLDERRLWLKFFTVSHLHRDHAAGLAEVSRYFDRATFVYPEAWIAHRKGRSLDNLAKCSPAADEVTGRRLAFSYEDVWEFDLAGETLAFLRAPYHSPTDQLVVFRGVGIRPDWHLPSFDGEPCNLADASDAEKRLALQRVLAFNTAYSVHSHLAAHGDGGLENDFIARVELALRSLG